MDTYNKDAILPSSLGRGPPAIIVIFQPVCFAILSITVAKVIGSLSMALLTYVSILLTQKGEHSRLILTVNLIRGQFRHLGSMFFNRSLHVIARSFILCCYDSIYTSQAATLFPLFVINRRPSFRSTPPVARIQAVRYYFLFYSLTTVRSP